MCVRGDNLQRLLVASLAYNAPLLEQNFRGDDPGLGATRLQVGPAPSNVTTLEIRESFGERERTLLNTK